MMCSLAKLFWVTFPGPEKCSGPIEIFAELTSVTDLLKDHKCYEPKDGFEVSAEDLILNRITPFQINKDNLANITVCRFHKVNKAKKKNVTISETTMQSQYYRVHFINFKNY